LNDDTRPKRFTPDCIDADPRPLVVNHCLRIGSGSPSSLFGGGKRFPDKHQLPNEETRSGLNDHASAIFHRCHARATAKPVDHNLRLISP
jgi:hypothetical protein